MNQRRPRVMPLGDSITHGAGSSHDGGYRRDLARLLAEAGQQVDFVGSQYDEVAGLSHEGHSGWEIDDLTAEITGWLRAAEPTAVLLHIGTNDLDREIDIPGAPARLARLIDTILRASPSVTVFVASLAAVGSDVIQARIDAFNAAIPGLLAERAQHDVRFVDLAKELTSADAADHLHPNDRGYATMARIWFTALTG